MTSFHQLETMSTTISNITDPPELSSSLSNSTDVYDIATPSPFQRERSHIVTIITYVGSAVTMVGVLFTLFSYIGYRKFNVKRPHIIMVNLCICLLAYYFAYIVSNNHRQTAYLNPFHHHGHELCLFGVIVCQFSLLAAWVWIAVNWMILLVMYQRPMGGHVSHFFIKAAIPAYGLPLLITVIGIIVANSNDDLAFSNKHITDPKGYYSSQCFVTNNYLYVGCLLPFSLLFIPIFIIFVLILRGLTCNESERPKTSTASRNVKTQFPRLTVITILFAIMALTSFVIPSLDPTETSAFVSEIVFSAVSSLLGISLMILFCVRHDEIRGHWMSVLRGERATMRQHSMTRKGLESGNMTSGRKSSTLMGNHPSVYIENFDDERKSSTYRIVAKEDTDMSTLGLIQIPGTPSPNRIHDAKAEKSTGENAKTRRKKSEGKRGSPKNASDDDSQPLTPKSKDEGFGDFKDKGDTNTWTKSRKKKQSRSSSTPPVSPGAKSTKRQRSSDDVLKASNATGSRNGHSNTSDRKRAKRSNSSTRMVTRFTRKSTSTVDDDTVQLTEIN